MPKSRVAAYSQEWAAALFIGLLAVSIPLLTKYWAGAVDIPRNDDLAFTRIVFRLVEDRALHLIVWNDMNLVGHLIWPVPLLVITGPSVGALHHAQAILSIIGLLSVYAVARHFLSKGYALLVLLMVAAFSKDAYDS
jgi:hypothetical protein